MENVLAKINGPALIVAHDQSLGIGKNNKLPWHIPGDMKFFREITCKPISEYKNGKNVVIMGRKTWESLPKKFQPLPDRINVVLSKNPQYILPSALRCASLTEAMKVLGGIDHGRVFLIGGASIYKEAINMDAFSTLYVTEIEGKYDCDVFFPEYRSLFCLVQSGPTISEGEYKYCHKTYVRTPI